MNSESLRKILFLDETTEGHPVILKNSPLSAIEKSCVLLQIRTISFQKSKEKTVVCIRCNKTSVFTKNRKSLADLDG